MDSATFQTIQSVCVVGGLMLAGFGLFFTAYEVRQRRKQDRFGHYVRFLSTYAESIKLLVEHRDLHALYEYSSEDCLKTYPELTPEEMAFWFRRVTGTGAFLGMLAGEAAILASFWFTNISFLWYNVIGCVVVVATGIIVSFLTGSRGNGHRLRT